MAEKLAVQDYSKLIEFIQNCTNREQLRLIRKTADCRISELEHNDDYGAGKTADRKSIGVDIAANPGRPG